MHHVRFAGVSLSCESPSRLSKDASWWKIYESSFPCYEREAKEAIFRILKKKRGLVISASARGKTIGMTTVHLLRTPPAVFLGYLAVSPRMRHHHAGTMLFEYAWEAGASLLHEKGLEPLGFFWEVEDPRMAKNGRELTLRKKRIKFYEHRGGQVLPHRYFVPPLTENSARTPMLLMFRGYSGVKMTLMNTKNVIRAIYREKYGEINHINRLTLRVLLRNLNIMDRGLS